MNEELVKSLTSLIDETLVEIEDLKKSRYSAAEVDMGKMDTMSNHPVNGSMDKKEDDEDEDKEKDHDKDMDKAEGKNSEADPGTRGVTAPDEHGVPGKSNLHAEAMKAEDGKDEDKDEDKEKDKKEMDKAEGKNSEADPGTRGVTAPTEASKPGHSNLHEEAKKSNDEEDSLKKSLEQSESLMKSYIDDKVGGLEAKLAGIADMVKELANQPVDRKGVAATAVPLKKSADEDAQPLQKSAVLNKLFEMKKSDPRSVDSSDICAVETGAGLQAIVEKYNLK